MIYLFSDVALFWRNLRRFFPRPIPLVKTRSFSYSTHIHSGSGQSFTRFLESFVTKSKIEITNIVRSSRRRKGNCVWSQAHWYVTSTIGNPTIHVSFYPDERGQNWSPEKESEQLSDYHSLLGWTINLWPRSNQPTNKITHWITASNDEVNIAFFQDLFQRKPIIFSTWEKLLLIRLQFFHFSANGVLSMLSKLGKRSEFFFGD